MTTPQKYDYHCRVLCLHLFTVIIYSVSAGIIIPTLLSNFQEINIVVTVFIGIGLLVANGAMAAQLCDKCLDVGDMRLICILYIMLEVLTIAFLIPYAGSVAIIVLMGVNFIVHAIFFVVYTVVINSSE